MTRARRFHRVFMVRTASIFASHKIRARKYGVALVYNLEDLRALAAEQIPQGCLYCSVSLTFQSFSFDHIQPISRGGAHAIENLFTVCSSCNKEKGQLTHREFADLLRLINAWDPKARRDVRSRLKMGGRFFQG